jgi:SPOR domain
MDDLLSDDFARREGAYANRGLPSGMRRALSAVVFLVLVGAMGVWAYRLGTRDAMEVPIVRAMQGPARVAPDDPGGYETAHQGREINKVLEGRPVPAPRHVVLANDAPLLSDEDKPQSELAVASQSKAVAELVEQIALEAPAEDPVAEETALALVEPAPEPGDEAVPLMAIPPAEDEAMASTALPGPRPISRPANLVRISAPAKTEPARPGAARPEPVAPAAQVREVRSVSSGSRLVQLGAFDSEANTRAAWQRLVTANSDLLSTKSLYVERTTNSARVFYRLRVAGFENTDQTRDICEALRARSIDCIPVTLR